MIVSLLLLIALAASGASLTYLVARDKPLMWRLAAGNIISSAVFGLVSFVVACLAGFSAVTVGISLVITALPLVLMRSVDLRGRAIQDWERAKGKMQGFTPAKFLRLLYYAFFFVVFWYFFDRTIYELKDGLYTGGSNNYGDLPFHLGAIFSFTEINNFPPVNPSWAGAKFSYPFIADLLTACYMKVGGELKAAMFVQNISWAFSLLVLFEHFVASVTGSKLAGRIAPALLFFSGGLGFAWAFKDMSEHAKGISDFIANLPRDYTISDKFRWGNTMVVLFMTQRSLLLGMPLVVLVLGGLCQIFNGQTDLEIAEKVEKKGGLPIPDLIRDNSVAIAVGLLAGMLPLIHLHSLAALFIVTAFLFAFRIDKWKSWLIFGIATAVVAVPFLAWAMAGSASETSKFFEFFFGWDKKPDESFVWFWIKNTGILFPMIALGLWLFYKDKTATAEVKEGEEKPKAAFPRLVLFYIPFVALFVISNIAKLAPWQWDNIKVLVYWFLLSIPFVAYGLAWLWEKGQALKVVSIACLVALTLAGGLDVFRTMAGVTKFRVFDADAMKMAEQVKAKTAPNALFLNAPTFNTATVLTGRQSLMRFTAHLTSHGIDPGTREQDVKQIYQGGAAADALLKKHNIDYVLVSPEERNTLKANEEFFKKFPLAVEVGEYRVYKVK
ncbi:MAG: hypothetical protein IPO41_07755 [Acidobacteria bacterium]|nr:hypothetical protein [Acidobacteriota bacterium]